MNGFDFQAGLSDAWSSVANFIPRLAGFLIILLVGWLIAKALAKGLDMLLRKLGMERLAEKSGLNRLFRNSSYDTSRLISRIVYYGLLLVVLTAAFGVFGANPISNVLNSIVAWLPHAIVAVVIVVVTVAIANVVRDLVGSALSSIQAGRFLATLAWVAIIAFGAIAAVNQIGVAQFVTNALLTAVLVAIVGVAIVGLGGGMIRPMQDRWGRWLDRAEDATRPASVPQARTAADDMSASQERPTAQTP